MPSHRLWMKIGLICLAAGCGQSEPSTDCTAATPAATPPAAVVPTTQAAAANPATPPLAPAPVPMIPFDDKKDHISFQYPGTWKPKEDKDYVLRLIPVQAAGDTTLSFDVPDLPFHIPGMIPLGMVTSGYVDDLKKQHADLHANDPADYRVADAPKTKFVQDSWKQNGKDCTNIALLIVHGDTVYILSAESPTADLGPVRADFDKVAASIKWTK